MRTWPPANRSLDESPSVKGSRTLTVALALTLVASGCGSVTPTPSPAATTVAAPTMSLPPGAAETLAPGPSASSKASTTGAPEATPSQDGGGEGPAVPPLPLPTLSEPFAIGEALYDPAREGVAVASLLNLMGVGIYARDGTPIRRGDEHSGGDPWLTEDEVRGLISMGVEDLEAGGDRGGGPYSLADLQDPLSVLQPGLTLENLSSAYGSAYAEHPDDLVPQVMLGQPIDKTTPLTRVQLWLLFMDGFIGPAGSGTGRATDGVRLAVATASARWGTARSRITPIPTPDPDLTADEWRELLAHLPTLADTVDFQVYEPRSVHEGHGRTGTTQTARAVVGRSRPLVSPVTGRTILQVRTGSRAGIPVTWRSRDESVLRRHGTLDASLPTTMATSDDGKVEVNYTPKKEDANGVGLVTRDTASLYATASKRDLVERTYVIAGLLLNALTRMYVHGSRVADRESFGIAWHEKKGIEVTLTNTYDVWFDISPTGVEGSAHRWGKDSATGVLTLRDDGTYRGRLQAEGTGATKLEFGGQTCDGTEDFHQSLDVVGTVLPLGTVDPALDLLGRGSFDGGDLLLRFYPAAPPEDDLGSCQGAIGYVGPGPDGRQISAWYAPFNDARWNTPSIGYQIHLPASGELEYIDYHAQNPSEKIESSWRVVVKRTAP